MPPYPDWVQTDAMLASIADAYGLDAAGRILLFELLGASIATVGAFVRRRVEAGDPNFIAMWNDLGGAKRYERRARWWTAEQHTFRAALR